MEANKTNMYRLKTSDVEAVQIDAQWLLFLNREKGIQASVGDYYYEDVDGIWRVMEKVRFERMFSPVQ